MTAITVDEPIEIDGYRDLYSTSSKPLFPLHDLIKTLLMKQGNLTKSSNFHGQSKSVTYTYVSTFPDIFFYIQYVRNDIHSAQHLKLKSSSFFLSQVDFSEKAIKLSNFFRKMIYLDVESISNNSKQLIIPCMKFCKGICLSSI